MRVIPPFLVATIAIAAGAGCGGNASSGTADPHASEHDEEDHVHHHHEAEHRPDDFPDAVRAAGLRYRGILWELEHEHGHTDAFAREFGELLDVIDWLPEFAADSEMRRAPWDRVNAASRKLRAAHAVVEEKLTTDAAPVSSDVDTARAEEALAELESLVGTERGDDQ